MIKLWLIVVCSLPVFCFGQNFYASGRIGLANYQGDLKASSVSFSHARMFYSLGARYDFSDHLTARSYVSLTSLHADDKDGTASMQQRNLNFTSKILEMELGAQYYIFSFNEKWWSPYLFAGIGLFHMNPYTKDTSGIKTFLKPLSTEGQGFMTGVKNYSSWQLSIPFGIGAEYSLDEDTRVGLEFGFRKTFTDYIDDVSTNYVDENALFNARGQRAVDLAWRGDEKNGGTYPAAGITRGNPKFKDAYYYIAITISRRIIFDQYKEIAGMPSGKKGKKSGCPATRY